MTLSKKNGGGPDREVLNSLLEAHRRFLFFLERRLGSREDAEDLLQSAFMKALEKGEPLRRGESAVAWFHRLLRRAIVDRYRSNDARARALEEWQERADPFPEAESTICQCIQDLLPALPEEQARLIRRIELDGRPPRDEARSLGISPNALAARLLRARRALFRELQRSCRVCAVHGCLDCHC